MKYIQFVFIFLIALLLLATPAQTNAATFTVINTYDSGAGSLRQAILDANVNNEDDTIVFDTQVFSVPQTINLTTGQLIITRDDSAGIRKSLTINGPGANLLTIDANKQSRVLLIEIHSLAIVSGVKITGGNGTGASSATALQVGGGGILAVSADKFVLINSVVTNNEATLAPASGGGLLLFGIYNTIINSTISNNTSIVGGGGIFASTQLDIINSTVSHNKTGATGGGIQLQGLNTLSLTNCTIAFNQVSNDPSFGGGIYINGSNATSKSLFSRNSIIAKNSTSDNSYGVDIAGPLGSGDFNIIGNTTGANILENSTNNQLNVDPQLDPELKINGGTIPTHMLSAGSPAIDRGNNCVLSTMASGGCLDLNITTDQRGVSRPQDGDGNGTAIVDIGAVEVLRSEVLSAISVPDLLAVNDTGASNSDNITSSRDLTFNVDKVTAGATVELFRNGIKIAEKVADGTSVTFRDNNLPADGTFNYAAREIAGNKTGLFSPALFVIIDNTAPTAAVNQTTGQSDPTRNQPINFTVVFNEPIFGFDASKVSLAASTAGVSSANVAVTGSGTTYEITVSNITADGIVRVNILPGAVQDAAGNPNIASGGTDNAVIFDTTRPTVTVNQAAGQSDPTRNQSINFTVVFSEIVNGFSKISVSLAGSTANVSNAIITITGSGTTYNVAVSNVTSNGGFVRLSLFESAAIDLASNASLPSTSTDNEVTIDNVSPTVTINQAAGQSDPTNQLPINFTVVFSEPVTGFDASDISLSGSSINTSGATITITGSGSTYNVAVSNLTSNGGILRASVRSGAATDLTGNPSFASGSSDNAVTIDNVSPSVSINQAIGQSDPASTQPINFTVVFNELVSDFDASDVSLDGSTANVSAATITVTGSGNVYNVQIGKITSGGQVRASIPSGAARDAAGNLSLASTSSDNTVTVSVKNAFFDFDGDGKSDISVFRPTGGTWYLLNSTAGFTGIQFGVATDKLVPADYDGDGVTDLAVYRSGIWYLNRSQLGFTGFAFGDANDIPQPADFDGDGRAELAVWRPSNGTWYVYNLATNSFTAAQFGASDDKPVAADYNGDGKADFAVFRPSNGFWYIAKATENPLQNFDSFQFGETTDKPVPADYDGDGKTDIAVYRPSNGTWYLNRSQAGFTGIQFGIATDSPVAADYDGDGKADVAVYRDGNWYLNRSTQGFLGVQFGAATDKSIPNSFVP